MAPILIDNRGLIKLGSIATLTAVLVFAGGFLTGYQRATVFLQAGSEVEHLPLPVNESTAQSDIEPQPPEFIALGEEIDVDQPEHQLSNIDTKAPVIAMSAKETSATEISDLEKKDLTVITDADNVATASTKEINNKNKNKKQQADTKTTVIVTAVNETPLSQSEKNLLSDKVQQYDVDSVEQTQQTLTTALTSAELHKIKYSIQVGMYGSLANAENMVEMLYAQQLDAYITDYINSSNKVRYNVRFGYFTDKKTALSNLKEYKNNLMADGYLVKFSADNIVDVAGVDKIKRAVSEDELESKQAPDTEPLALGRDKLSQANMLNTNAITAN